MGGILPDGIWESIWADVISLAVGIRLVEAFEGDELGEVFLATGKGSSAVIAVRGGHRRIIA